MKNILLASALFCSAISFAQVTVTPAGTPSQIATFLSGNGVTISNVSIYGQPIQYGYFTAFNSTLAMNGGLVLTTGDANNVIGPNNTASAWYSVGTIYGDSSLTAIEQSAVYDVCMIQFDCIPSDDTLYYNYLFGSEEYPEFVGASFNDAFGIFVYGTNPSGGSYNDTNMAILPNGTPVSINSINNGASNSGPCMNCAYYLHNVNDTTIQYDGTTTNLMGILPVVPNQSYHIKIIIADAMDDIYDSGVFLQAGSFRCSAPTGIIEPHYVNTTAFPVPATSAVNFTFASLENSEVNVVFHSLDGKTVLTQNSQATNNVASVDVSSLSQGTYIAEITHDGIRESKMIVVAR